MRKERPKISMQFSDLKRDLSTITPEEWEALPDPTDASRKRMKKDSGRAERFTPVPDSVIAGGLARTAMATTLDPRTGLETPVTPAGTESTTADLTTLGRARTSLFSVKLDQASSDVSGQTNVDPKSYMTDLRSLTPKTDAEIGDIKKARVLLTKVTQTNPRHAPGWIALARLEEVAGQLQQARMIAMKGCEMCPRSEDMYLEAARLQTPEHAKAVVAEAVRAEHCPNSIKLWCKAAELETDVTAKRRVLRRALETLPQSVRLWKMAISLEKPDDARIMLSRAVECCPDEVDLWLALAKLEMYDKARQVLNKAREAIPTDRQIWIAASRLEEANGKAERADVLIQRALESLEGNGVQVGGRHEAGRSRDAR